VAKSLQRGFDVFGDFRRAGRRRRRKKISGRGIAQGCGWRVKLTAPSICSENFVATAGVGVKVSQQRIARMAVLWRMSDGEAGTLREVERVS